MTDLRKALAQPVDNSAHEAENMHRNVDSVNMSEKHVQKSDKSIHEREWVGLTDEERQEIVKKEVYWSGIARAIEARLKEKNSG